MKRVVIVGFGRFGELLANMSVNTFDITIVENDPKRAKLAQTKGYVVAILEVVKNADLIFLAVPISQIEKVLIKLAPLINKNQVVMDFCSVKVYPINLMRKHLRAGQILGTHPMFGPDSAKTGLSGLQVALCPINIKPDNLKLIKAFWVDHGLTVTETTPDAHDYDTVYSQALTYSIAKIILNMNLMPITFTTKSFNALSEIANLSANDSDQLFHDMLFYNPYFLKMKSELEIAINKTSIVLSEI